MNSETSLTLGLLPQAYDVTFYTISLKSEQIVLRNMTHMLAEPVSNSVDGGRCNEDITHIGCTPSMQSMTSTFQRILYMCVSPGEESPTSTEDSTNSSQSATKVRPQNLQLPVKNIYRKPISKADIRPRSRSFSPNKTTNPDIRPRAKTYNSYPGSGLDVPMMIHTKRRQLLNISHGERRRSTIDSVPLRLMQDSDEKVWMIELRQRASTVPSVHNYIFKPGEERPPAAEIMCSARNDAHMHPACSRYMDNDIYNEEGVHASTIYMPSTSMSSKCQILYDRQDTHKPQDDLVCLVNGRVMQSIDERGNKRNSLILTIETKGNCIKEKTSVKALSNGKVIIVSLVSELTNTPITKRLPLPWMINPYHVKASVQTDGILTIRAPVVTDEHKFPKFI